MHRSVCLIILALTGCSDGACPDRDCGDELLVSIADTYLLEDGAKLLVDIEGKSVSCVAEQAEEKLIWTCDDADVFFVGPRSVSIYGTPTVVELSLLDSSGDTLASSNGKPEYEHGDECWNERCQYAQMQL